MLALTALVVALSACSAAPPAATGLPDGVTVELRQLRSDVADRTAQVRVTNGTAAVLVITRVDVVDARFATAAVRDRRSTIGPGRTVDLRIALPTSSCDAPRHDPPSSHVELRLDDGTVIGTDLPDPLGFIDPLHDRECLAQRAGEVAVLEWRDFVAGEPSGSLTLGIRPTGGDHDLELVAVRETNLLQFPDAARSWSLDVSVDPQGADGTIAVPIVPSRCDPHAVQEDKRGTVFTLEIRLDGVDGTVELPAGDALRGELLTWVGEVCGFPAA